MFTTILDRLSHEPVAVRAALAALLTYLVAADVIDVGSAEAVEHVTVAVLDLLLIASARKRVTPERA